MPTLRPFRGIRYNPRVVPDTAAVLCPPYDVISPEQRQALAARDPHNAVHLELPAASDASDVAAPYREAARLFARWQDEGVLHRDAQPTLYVYEQRYTSAAGAPRVARGFFCLLRLESFGPDSSVRPHERTMAGPKEDRYRLLEAANANLSPVVLLYESAQGGGLSTALLDQLTAVPPLLETTDDSGVDHLLWAAEPEASKDAESLLAAASAGPLTIADGHHRYETALRYRDALRAGKEAGETAADSVMVLLYDAAAGGLEVLPTHRLIRGEPTGSALIDALGEFFDVTPRDMLEDVLAELAQPGRIGLWGDVGGMVLEARRQSVESVLPAGASETLRWLDVTVLSSVLPRLYGSQLHEMVDSRRLTYVKDAREGAAAIQHGDAHACFLLPPTPTTAVLAVAAAGEQMPHKSTYFHPKAATGLVFNPLAE